MNKDCLFSFMKAELKKSLKIIGLLVFIAAFVSTISPILLPHSFIMQNVPVCKYKSLYNKECFACGLTGAFCDISNGNLSEAGKKNAASVPLYMFFLLYQVLFVYFTSKQVLPKFKMILKI